VLYEADSRLKEAGSGELDQRSVIYSELLRAVREAKGAAALQLGGTLIKAHAGAFPALIGESAASLSSLCAHDEVKVRLTALSALPIICVPTAPEESVGSSVEPLGAVLGLLVGVLLKPRSPHDSRTAHTALVQLLSAQAARVLIAASTLPPAATPAAPPSETQEAAPLAEDGRAEAAAAPSPPTLPGVLLDCLASKQKYFPEWLGQVTPKEAEPLKAVCAASLETTSAEARRSVLQALVAALDAALREPPDPSASTDGAADPAAALVRRSSEAGSTRPPSRVLFVGGLHPKVTNKPAISKEFSRFGVVEHVHLCSNHAAKPYAFASMAEQANAVAAYEAFMAGTYRPFNSPHTKLGFANGASSSGGTRPPPRRAKTLRALSMPSRSRRVARRGVRRVASRPKVARARRAASTTRRARARLMRRAIRRSTSTIDHRRRRSTLPLEGSSWGT